MINFHYLMVLQKIFNQLDEYLELNKKKSENIIGGLFKLKHKNHLVFFDVGSLQKKVF